MSKPIKSIIFKIPFLRVFLFFLTGIWFITISPDATAAIDRKKLVQRHNPLIDSVDPWAPLSVGNGDFAFTVDITGLQSFSKFYYENGIPLETMSNWLWHAFPNTKGFRFEDACKQYTVHGRQVSYASLEKSPAGQYFRINPHPLPMGKIGFEMRTSEGIEVLPADLETIHQTLDLWSGMIFSQFDLNGKTVTVETVGHPQKNCIAVRIRSDLLLEGSIKPYIHFPYTYDPSIKNKPPIDFDHPRAHQTLQKRVHANHIRFDRIVDNTKYSAHVIWSGKGEFKKTEPHRFVFESGSDELEMVFDFSRSDSGERLPSFAETVSASSKAWEHYWMSGGVIDLSESTDPRAQELERKIVLSQYLVKVNYAGAFPPQESGLTHISWYGKHNTEMYWWHSAHFVQWGREEYLEKSLPWYRSILPEANALATLQGLEGARWPKMTDPSGAPSPGNINPFIIWNQPHVIYLAELLYRQKPGQETLDKYKELVFESANYLASYAHFESSENRYVLGPPVKSVSEDFNENQTKNPTFELAYWHYGLSLAQQWRERLGMNRHEQWDHILTHLSALPVQEGLYLDIETETDMYDRPGGISSSMLMALGFLPQISVVDPDIMRNTLHKVIEKNSLKNQVSWTSGKVAMTAARLGETEIAIDILTNDDEKFRFLANGHCRRPKEPLKCPAYLPVNSALLSTVALMAAGWQGAPEVNAPGFPQDGQWVVKWEGLNALP